VGAGVEPRGAAAQDLDLEIAQREIAGVDIGDLELAASRGPDLARDVDHSMVVEVEAGHRVVGAGPRGLLFDAHHLACCIELDHAVSRRILYVVAEDGGALAARGGLLEHLAQVLAVEDVVAQHQTARRAGQKIPAEQERLRQPIGRRLGHVAERQAPLAPVTQQPLERRQVLGRGDDQDLPHPAQHEGRERVVDHRLVVDGKELLADRAGNRVQPGAGAAGQNDALPPDGAPVGHLRPRAEARLGGRPARRCRWRSGSRASAAPHGRRYPASPRRAAT
jgi:hypothetical protein